MTEQRVIASAKPKIGARPQPAAVPEPEKPAKKGKKKKLILLLAVVLLVGGGAGYWFFLKPAAPAAGAEAVATPAPEPGKVVVIDPISLNLAEGHYLQVGIGLQLTKAVSEDPDTARALDQVVSLFSGRSVAEVTSAEGREALRAELVKRLAEVYEGEVMDVYFTDYVTQ